MLTCGSNMTLLLALSINWALLLTVDSLECYSCEPPCTSEVLTTCPSSSDSVCLTHTLFVDKTVTIGKYCTQSVECRTRPNVLLDYSLNFGVNPMSESVLCCDSDGCNKQTLPVPSQEPNGLQCGSCSNYSDTVCNTPVNCVGLEDTCAEVKASAGLLKGCVTPNMCSVPLMATFVSTVTGDGMSCGAAKNIPTTTTSVLNTIFPTLVPVKTTHPVTNGLAAPNETTQSIKNTAPSTGPLSVGLMPMWFTVIFKLTN